jgi:2-methylfumaryl-CoA hydratase|tara:strand:- start:845 stop:1906 length:1062 start_codon:yes stop_codon:yes gene_type:complete
MKNKINPGNFFEDFFVGQELKHSTPRTISSGDVSLFIGLLGSRFVLHSSKEFAKKIGFKEAPIDDILTFNMVFGKTVPDISLNSPANLGYAACKFIKPVYVGDTIKTTSKVLGVKENSNKKTGIVWVNSIGKNQKNEVVLDYIRWVMVNKKNESSPAPKTVIPELKDEVSVEDLTIPEKLNMSKYDFDESGSKYLWDDYQVGEKIDHIDGMTVEEADHMTATRLYQNTAKVHFNEHTEKEGRLGRRIVYGGHIISLVRMLSFNGLSNAFKILAINNGKHVSPTVANNTIYAWSEILDKKELQNNKDIGALRIKSVGVKDNFCNDFPLYKNDDKEYNENVVLEIDYWVLIPKKK